MSTGLPIHPAADLFPMLPASELQALADDIRDNGQREPVVLWDGQVLDGRNRLAACDLAGVEPLTRTLDVCPDPLAFVLSANLRRRHLSTSQLAMVAGRVAMTAGPNLVQDGERVRDAAARMVGGVEKSSIILAIATLKHGQPELVDLVDRNELAVSVAAKAARFDPERQRELATLGPEAIREAVKAEVKPREPKDPPKTAGQKAVEKIRKAANFAAMEEAFQESVGLNLPAADIDAVAKARRERGAELRESEGQSTKKAAPVAEVAAAPSTTPAPAPAPAPPPEAPKGQASLFTEAPAPVSPQAATAQPVSAAAPPLDASEIEALRAEVEAWRAWAASLADRALRLPLLVKNSAPNLDRARKLVELAGSPNDNEANVAARQACRMIREQGIRLTSDHPLISSDPLERALRELHETLRGAGVQL